jgi:hypothetical protein
MICKPESKSFIFVSRTIDGFGKIDVVVATHDG